MGSQRERRETNGVNIDTESEQNENVFAHFGLAMFQAQCLERQLAIILATKYEPGPTNISRTELDDIFDDLFSRTLGQLVEEIGRLAELTEDEEERLQEALSKRNWLAHRYFWERAIEILSEPGRASMITELQEAAYFFQTLDELFANKTIEWAETVGISQQTLDKELERLVRDQGDS